MSRQTRNLQEQIIEMANLGPKTPSIQNSFRDIKNSQFEEEKLLGSIMPKISPAQGLATYVLKDTYNTQTLDDNANDESYEEVQHKGMAQESINSRRINTNNLHYAQVKELLPRVLKAQNVSQENNLKCEETQCENITQGLSNSVGINVNHLDCKQGKRRLSEVLEAKDLTSRQKFEEARKLIHSNNTHNKDLKKLIDQNAVQTLISYNTLKYSNELDKPQVWEALHAKNITPKQRFEQARKLIHSTNIAKITNETVTKSVNNVNTMSEASKEQWHQENTVQSLAVIKEDTTHSGYIADLTNSSLTEVILGDKQLGCLSTSEMIEDSTGILGSLRI